LRDGLDQVDVEADQFLLRGFEFEGAVGTAGADHVGLVSREGAAGSTGQGQRAGGQGEQFLEGHDDFFLTEE
jgi:hypothetical protein